MGGNEKAAESVSGAGLIRENARQTLWGQWADQPSSVENAWLQIDNNTIEKEKKRLKSNGEISEEVLKF